MADTRVQVAVEDWVRDVWMPQALGQVFHRMRLPLSSGGVFDFDAVSADRRLVASISTSGARTAGGKHAVGKLMKIRSDMLFLLLAEADRKILVFTERDMVELCQRERAGGRVPSTIEFIHAELPHELSARLAEARRVASDEVKPRAGAGGQEP